MSYLLLIGGPSCAGKTYISSYIKDLYKDKVEVINLDSYYKDFSNLSLKERSKLNFDSPDAFDFKSVIEDIKKLKNNEDIDIPIYDFKEHKRLKEKRHVKSSELIILEGILTLYYDELVSLFDLRVFIKARETTCFSRRLIRDQLERGRSEESIIYQFNNVVVPMQKLYLNKTINKADLVLVNNENNGPLIFGKPLLEKIQKILEL